MVDGLLAGLRMKSQTAAFIGLAILVMTAYSCKLDLVEEEWEGDGGTIHQESDLFENSADSDWYRLQINNWQFLDQEENSQYGSSLWTPLENRQDPFDSWEIEVIKRSGEGNAGYGMVLCQQSDAEGTESMLSVMIRVDGYYQIGKVRGRRYSTLIGWKRPSDPDYLRKGYGSSNIIEVRREGDEFILIFNGHSVERFRDEGTPVHEGGVQGFIAVISPLERFPSVPVHVEFRETSK